MIALLPDRRNEKSDCLQTAKRIAIVLLIGSFSILEMGCAKSLYKKAVRNNSIEELRKVCEYYPSDRYCGMAIEKIDQLYYTKAMNPPTKEKLEAYLRRKTKVKNYEKPVKEKLLFLKAYSTNTLMDLLEFITFFIHNNQHGVTAPEYESMLTNMEQLCDRQKSGTGYIVLYNALRKKEYLEQAYKYRSSISDSQYEKVLVKEYPDRYFSFGKCTPIEASPERQAANPNTDYVTYECSLTSNAKIGHYLIDTVLSLPITVEVRKWKILMEKGIETVEASNRINLPAKGQTSVEFKAGPIKFLEGSWIKTIRRNISGPPTLRITNVQLIERAGSRTSEHQTATPSPL